MLTLAVPKGHCRLIAGNHPHLLEVTGGFGGALTWSLASSKPETEEKKRETSKRETSASIF